LYLARFVVLGFPFVVIVVAVGVAPYALTSNRPITPLSPPRISSEAIVTMNAHSATSIHIGKAQPPFVRGEQARRRIIADRIQSQLRLGNTPLEHAAFSYLVSFDDARAREHQPAWRTVRASRSFSRALFVGLTALDEASMRALCTDEAGGAALLRETELTRLIERRNHLLGVVLERLGEQGEDHTLR